MERRNFIQNITAITALSSFGLDKVLPYDVMSPDFENRVFALLKSWCDGLIKHQINDPSNRARHGAIYCEADQSIHGRCHEAVLPFMEVYKRTKDKRYLESAINVFEWGKNVSEKDGAWRVVPKERTWTGISVFGAIALGETLINYSELLPEEILVNWTERLKTVAEHIFKNFNMTFTNINYGYSAIYGLYVCGHTLHQEKYTNRSKELAAEAKNWLTTPNKLIFGEGKPGSILSAKGLKAVDLGYNIEETLVNATLYAHAASDQALLADMEHSLASHLEFMLPDGGWDNSWGTRQYKWSYWGSRTTDGSLPALLIFSDSDTKFSKAAFRYFSLLEKCTKDGLLHGGPHFNSKGVLPCVHHTFCHAKSLTTALHLKDKLNNVSSVGIMPCDMSFGLKKMDEIDVWLVNKNNWIASVSSYDLIYRSDAQHVSGGAIGMLYHKIFGPILSGSMAKYMLVETFNQQTTLEENYSLTPRIEYMDNGVWFTNLYDMKAVVKESNFASTNEIHVTCRLCNDLREAHHKLPAFNLVYTFHSEYFEVTVSPDRKISENIQLTIPIISKNIEDVSIGNGKKILIRKNEGNLKVEGNRKFTLPNDFPERKFNLVPGFEVLPVSLNFSRTQKAIIKIITKQ